MLVGHPEIQFSGDHDSWAKTPSRVTRRESGEVRFYGVGVGLIRESSRPRLVVGHPICNDSLCDETHDREERS